MLRFALQKDLGSNPPGSFRLGLLLDASSHQNPLPHLQSSIAFCPTFLLQVLALVTLCLHLCKL